MYNSKHVDEGEHVSRCFCCFSAALENAERKLKTNYIFGHIMFKYILTLSNLIGQKIKQRSRSRFVWKSVLPAFSEPNT